MPKCTYCGKMYQNPRGLTYILKDGTVKYLCSSKCRKNMLMKRRTVRWISKKKKEKIIEAPEEPSEGNAEVMEEAKEEEAKAEEKADAKENREKAEVKE